MASRKSGRPAPRRGPQRPERAPARARARPEPLADLTGAVELVDAGRRALLRATARRPDDLMVAELTLHNLRVVPGAPPTLRRVDARRDAVLVVELPPQSFGEEAFLDRTGPEVPSVLPGEFPSEVPPDRNVPTAEAEPLPPLGGTRLRMAGPSRLAFTMPDGVTSVPYTLEAVLDACRSWPVRRALTAAPEPARRPELRDVGDLDVLGAVVGSADFASAQRDLLAALRERGTGEAESAAVAAARRVADDAAAALRSRDPSRSAPLIVARLRAEVDALGARFAGLRDRPARALATVAVARMAAAELARQGLTTRPGLEAVPSIPFLPLLVGPHRPARDVTALELPYRLITSPIAPARWTHRTTAVAQRGRHELWHTRLTTAPGHAGPGAPGRVRAIWSEDYPRTEFSSVIDRPFRMPLDAQDRRMLVQVTAGFDERTPADAPYRPRPADARRVVLSALGALLDVDGAWAPARPEGVDLEAWRHLAALGRDQYVRVVYAGFLLPFGHAASLVKVTERKFEGLDAPTGRSRRVAVLRQRFFVVVREPVKRFDGSYHATGGHAFPFTSVELLTRVTPDLLAPTNAACRVVEVTGRPIYEASGVTGGVTRRQAFWPMLAATPGVGDFRFDVAAVDRAGARSTFSMPLLFMSEVANTRQVARSGQPAQPLVDNVAAAYDAATPARREPALGGATVCYAPPDAGGEGDPRLPTQSMRFRAGPVSARSTTRVNVHPETEEARVALRAVQRLLGRDDALVSVRYPQLYATQGFGAANPGEVFLELVPANGPWSLAFGGGAQQSKSDALGAIASPSMAIEGVSRRVGPAADLAQVTAGRFDPRQFFADARILGGIPLADVLDAVPSLAGPEVPQLVTRELPAGGGLPARVEARYDWRTRLARPDPINLLLPSADGSNPSPFAMQAVMTAPVGSPADAVASAVATLGNFKVNLFGFIVLWFRELRFAAEHGRKPDVAVELHPTHGVRFGGPLEFVNQLKDLIPGSGFSDPPAISVTPSGIAASYALGVPSVQVGVFALSNLSIGARFSLPFDARPVEVGFNFAERHDPFSLTVSLLGGGGFLAIGVGADGVREIEAALEAGARLAIDLGVASGSVEVMAGVYFHWLTGGADDGVVELSGYVRLRGELDVMGLISASLTFNLQLAYTKTGDRSVVWGEATLVVEIEVLVFSGEVTVRCRREFGGSEADPTFAQLVPGHDTWSSYCLAFAED